PAPAPATPTSARTTTSARPAPAGRSPTTSASSAPSASRSPSAASPNQTPTPTPARQPAPRPPDHSPTSPAGQRAGSAGAAARPAEVLFSGQALLPPLSSLTGPGPVSRSGHGGADRVRRCPQAGHAGHLDRPVNPLEGGAPARHDRVPAALQSARRPAGACGANQCANPTWATPAEAAILPWHQLAGAGARSERLITGTR